MLPFFKNIYFKKITVCTYLGTLRHVWKLVVSSFCNMFLIKLNKTIPINDI